MSAKLHITVQIDTPLAEVFAFKCIAAQDMNLEIRVRNDGDVPVSMRSRCEFSNEAETVAIDYLYPAGPQIVAPGDAVAFYCFMDAAKFAEFDSVTLFDIGGKSYSKYLRK